MAAGLDPQFFDRLAGDMDTAVGAMQVYRSMSSMSLPAQEITALGRLRAWCLPFMDEYDRLIITEQRDQISRQD